MTTPVLCRPPKIHPVSATQACSPVYFFLDFSNIAINARQVGLTHGDGFMDSQSIRLSSSNLRLFAQRNRLWGGGYAAVGLNDQQSQIKRHFEQAGIRFDICERGKISGKEQNIDQRIQLEMYRLLSPSFQKGTVVLATGDGNGFADRRGFVEALATLHSHGFAVEVLSWRHSFNRFLKSWAVEHGQAIELDKYYADLTFVHARRPATALYCLSRKLVRDRLI